MLHCPLEHCRELWSKTQLLQGYLASVRWQPLTRQITTRPAATTSIQTPNSSYLAPQMLTGRTQPLTSPSGLRSLTAWTRAHHSALRAGTPASKFIATREPWHSLFRLCHQPFLPPSPSHLRPLFKYFLFRETVPDSSNSKPLFLQFILFLALSTIRNCIIQLRVQRKSPILQSKLHERRNFNVLFASTQRNAIIEKMFNKELRLNEPQEKSGQSLNKRCSWAELSNGGTEAKD